MKRRWRVVLLRNKGEILGQVEALTGRQRKWPQPSSLIWTKSSATGSWCMSLAERVPRGKYLGECVGGPPKDESEHFTRCPARGGLIDCRGLVHVFEHEGTLPHPAQD
jgi:hypothetical protein